MMSKAALLAPHPIIFTSFFLQKSGLALRLKIALTNSPPRRGGVARSAGVVSSAKSRTCRSDHYYGFALSRSRFAYYGFALSRSRFAYYGFALSRSRFAYYGFALSRSRFAPVCAAFGGFASSYWWRILPSSARRGFAQKIHRGRS